MLMMALKRAGSRDVVKNLLHKHLGELDDDFRALLRTDPPTAINTCILYQVLMDTPILDVVTDEQRLCLYNNCVPVVFAFVAFNVVRHGETTAWKRGRRQRLLDWSLHHVRIDAQEDDKTAGGSQDDEKTAPVDSVVRITTISAAYHALSTAMDTPGIRLTDVDRKFLEVRAFSLCAVPHW
jgi:hypothetical protein